jgi:hypothetical protein
MFLDKYSKNTPPPAMREGTMFVQNKGKKGKKTKNEDTDEGDLKKKDNPFKDVKCFKCKKKGHQAKHCPDEDKDVDSALTGSKASLKLLKKQMKLVQKSFA